MRIVGGQWRSRTIQTPDGRATRPTTDRMREAIASVVLSACDLDLCGMSVLDAFAGSGAVGLELLSRGASTCLFCERDRHAASIARSNCTCLGVPGSAWRVLCGDVTKLVHKRLWGSPFHIVFLDPPYAMGAGDVREFVKTLRDTKQLAEECLILYERASNAPCMELEGAELLRTKAMASSSIDVLRMCD